jgi:glycerol uptake facilitator-like aquaporin
MLSMPVYAAGSVSITFINPAMEELADVLSGKLSPVGEIPIRLNKDPIT